MLIKYCDKLDMMIMNKILNITDKYIDNMLYLYHN